MDPISHEMIEELLKGSSSPQSLPPELAKVAHLMATAQAPATGGELAGSHMAVEAFMAAKLSTIPTGGKEKVLSKFLSAKAAIAAAAIALTGGAAAATGALVSSHHAVTTPDIATVNSGTQSNTTTKTTSPLTTLTTIANENQGMISGHSLFGLCTAYLASTKASAATGAQSSTSSGTSTSMAFAQLALLASANPSLRSSSGTGTTAFCNYIVTTYKPGSKSGATNSNAAAGNAKGKSASSLGSANASQGASANSGSSSGATPEGGTTVSGSTPNITVPPVTLPGHVPASGSQHSKG